MINAQSFRFNFKPRTGYTPFIVQTQYVTLCLTSL
nr:MAG TPA: hypothetical protein [Caudoviricetes sp.]